MAMSKKFVRMHKDKRAEMGVGTMIIFIAMVLVAAVAASVLISTANTVREQATQTGNDAITGVSSGFDIKYVKGNVVDNTISSMDIYVQLSPGSPPLRMGDVIISMTAGGTSGELIFNGPKEGEKKTELNEMKGTADVGLYNATLVPAASTQSAFSQYGTIYQGNLTKITVQVLGGEVLQIQPGDDVLIKIMPNKGAPMTVSFTVPPVLSNGYQNLR